MWSRVATFSATSTGFRMGRSRTDVFRRMRPDSGARRARTGNGCGHTVGCESQCWPIDTQANPMRDAAATTSMASSMICVGVRSVGLQNGVRWKPIFMTARPYRHSGDESILATIGDLEERAMANDNVELPVAPRQAVSPRGVNHIVLNVRNLETSHAFWTEIMGFRQAAELKPKPGHL